MPQHGKFLWTKCDQFILKVKANEQREAAPTSFLLNAERDLFLASWRKENYLSQENQARKVTCPYIYYTFCMVIEKIQLQSVLFCKLSYSTRNCSD